MRICIFQSSYDGADNALEEVDHSSPDPAMFTSQHEFHHRYIHKATAAAEIDAAVTLNPKPISIGMVSKGSNIA